MPSGCPYLQTLTTPVRIRSVNQEINPDSEQSDELTGETAAEQPLNEKKYVGHLSLSQETEAVVARFAACGRCSFFLAGYRVIHGDEMLEETVRRVKSGWLTLAWNHAMRELVTKSYGVRLNVDYAHYEGRCTECGRHFIYQDAETARRQAQLRMELRSRRSGVRKRK